MFRTSVNDFSNAGSRAVFIPRQKSPLKARILYAFIGDAVAIKIRAPVHPPIGRPCQVWTVITVQGPPSVVISIAVTVGIRPLMGVVRECISVGSCHVIPVTVTVRVPTLGGVVWKQIIHVKSVEIAC